MVVDLRWIRGQSFLLAPKERSTLSEACLLRGGGLSFAVVCTGGLILDKHIRNNGDGTFSITV